MEKGGARIGVAWSVERPTADGRPPTSQFDGIVLPD